MDMDMDMGIISSANGHTLRRRNWSSLTRSSRIRSPTTTGASNTILLPTTTSSCWTYKWTNGHMDTWCQDSVVACTVYIRVAYKTYKSNEPTISDDPNTPVSSVRPACLTLWLDIVNCDTPHWEKIELMFQTLSHPQIARGHTVEQLLHPV